MRKSSLHTFIKFLPLVIIVILILMPTDAFAFDPIGLAKKLVGEIADAFLHVVDKALDYVGGKVANMLGLGGECEFQPSSKSNCLFCTMFDILFEASAQVAGVSYSAFNSDLGQIVLIFLAVVLALSILRNLATMGAQDTGSILNELFSKAFVCAAIYLIITQNYVNFLNWTILPILQDGLSFVGLTGSPAGYTYSSGATGNEILPSRIGELVNASIRTIEVQINTLFDYGSYAWCRGTKQDLMYHFIPNPIFLIDGVLLYIGGVFFIAAYPWILADAVLQLGISLALMPFGIVGYAFGPTKKYLPKLFSWILNSLFVFIFMSIVIHCILRYVNVLLTHIFSSYEPSTFFIDPGGLAFYGSNMVKLLFILVIGWTYMPQMRELAQKFSEGSGLSAATTVGTSMVTNPIEKISDKVGDWATSAAGSAALTTGRTTLSGLNRGSSHVGRQVAFFVADKFGKRKSFNFAGTKYTHKTNSAGSFLVRKHKSLIGGRKHKIVSDRYSTIHYVFDSSGKPISSQVEFKHNFAKKYLFNKKGEINIGALDKLLDSPLGQDPTYRKAILAQVAEEAVKRKGVHVDSYYKDRTVTINGNKITVEQTDHNGSTTSFSLDFDRTTGQTAIGYEQDVVDTMSISQEHRKTAYFNNGVVEVKIEGVLDRHGTTIITEQTTTNYLGKAKDEYASVTSSDDAHKPVTSGGVIASGLQRIINGNPNPDYLLFGMDSFAGIKNIDGHNPDDFLLNQILRENSRRKTNKLETRILNKLFH